MNGDTRFVRFEILLAHEANVVRRNDGHTVFDRESERTPDVALLARLTDALQLEVVAIAEHRKPALEQITRFLIAPAEDGTADIALACRRQRDQSRGVLRRQPAAIDGRTTLLLTFQIGATDEPRQILVTDRVLAQQHQARRVDTLTVLANQQIDTDDRLHACGQGGLVELHHREQIALIGESHRRHRGLRDRIHEPDLALAFARDANDAVDQRILGVKMQMNERHRVDQAALTRSAARRTGSKLRR